MAGETKGFLSGEMKFGVGDDVDAPDERGATLPLRVLVVADLVPRGEHNAGASAPENAIAIDTARFDDLFAKLRPRVAIEVPSVLAEGKNARVDLAPTSLKSFRPDGLVTEVPLLRSLLDGRLALERLRDGSASPEQAQAELARLWSGSPFVREVLGLLPPKDAPRPAPTFATAPSEVNVESILDMVDLDGGAPPPSGPAAPPPPPPAAPTRFADVISAIAHSGKSGGGVRPTDAIARVERALGAQIGAILQHPEVRRLERLYRGLKLLADKAQGHSGVKLEVACARPEDAAAAFSRAVRTNASSLPPVSFAVVDLGVDGSAVGFTRLEAVADVAEELGVPAIATSTPGLFGMSSLDGLERVDNKSALYQAPQRAPWRAVAEKPKMLWVALAMNGVLARGPYDKATSRVREAIIKEAPADAEAYVWIEAAYAVASLVVASFKDTGWPCRVVGPKNGGLVENLPVREVNVSSYEGDAAVAIPTEAFVSTDTQRDLAKYGVLLLASAPNSDAAVVMHAPTAYVTPPKKTYDSATTEPEVRLERVPLGDQLFVARLSQFLRALASKLPPNADPAEAAKLVKGAAWALFEGARPGSVEIDVTAKKDGPHTSVAITVHPRRFLGVTLEQITLEVGLG